ncbi:hypothetical protein J2T09_004140 [Neorhizobium huautlense]|uniref:Uncharacterized protein n=1 Tax=Neorhizobium huautlense TaxID=67774 RepID=A0ABT9Q067_9HYPH|nr:hypothetical protein [Neorhizobium huautlense]MDP9839364.1 hypothetical protein [Neorhizobium huautlense]
MQVRSQLAPIERGVGTKKLGIARNCATSTGGSPATATAPNTPLWRSIYIVEIAILAIPTLSIMGLVAMLGTLYCSGMSLIGLGMLLGDALKGELGDESVGFLVLGSIGAPTSLSGLFAIYRFITLSEAYLDGSPAKLLEHKRDFRAGMLLAVAPLVATTVFAVSMMLSVPNVSLALPFLSGAVLFIPITHLWLALREAGRAMTKESA